MRARLLPATGICLGLLACAGRDPQPIAAVEPQDAYSDCAMINAEIKANNVKAQELGKRARLENRAKCKRGHCWRHYLACLVRHGF